MITSKFNYNETEVRDYLYFYYTRRDNKKWIYYIMSLLIVIIGVLLIIYYNTIFGSVVVIIGAVCLGIFPFNARAAAKKRAVKFSGTTPDNLTIREEGVIRENSHGKKAYKWSEFREIVETSKYYYLYITKTKALIINKGSIAHEDKAEMDTYISAFPNKHTQYK